MNKSWYWDAIINLQERRAELEPRLPNVTDAEFDEYTMIMALLGPLDTWIDKISDKEKK